MNNDTGELIQYVASGNLKLAKLKAEEIVAKDTSKSNEAYARMIKGMFEKSKREEVPEEMKNLIRKIDVSSNFNENRYYLSEREKIIFEEILSMYETSIKLEELGINYLNSLLLYGESGTGKTLFGQYIAYKLQLPFAYVRFSNLINSKLGETSKNIVKVFDYVKDNKCVLMLDEVDTIGQERGTDSLGEMSRVTAGVMQELDEIKGDTIILGATNRIDIMDKALLRRFTMKHEVKTFNEIEKYEMIKKFLEDVHIEYDEQNIKEYCKNNISQALIINNVIKAIAKSIKTGERFLI